MNWTKYLPSDVRLRLCECRNIKEDLPILVNAKWQTMLEKGLDIEGFTKEDALVSILDLLDSNGQYFDLSEDERGRLAGKKFLIKGKKLVRYYGDRIVEHYSDGEYVAIPDGIKEIEREAFMGCIHLVSVTIPNGVTRIGNNAFADCDNLKFVTIPDSVTEISKGAFYGCTNLENVVIPDSVTVIGDGAFADNVRLVIDKSQIRHIYETAIQEYVYYLFNIKAMECQYDSIVIDTETTGLTAGIDEILQLSIIDGNGNTLYNKHFRPIFHKSWSGAERVNRISPDIVADCPTFEEELRNIIPIIFSAKKIIGYNTSFDLDMLKSYGVYPNPNTTIVDVMRDFAPIYGEWNEKHNDWKWKKLIECADFYGYDWGDDKAHDSLSDCRATLFCYEEMRNT